MRGIAFKDGAVKAGIDWVVDETPMGDRELKIHIPSGDTIEVPFKPFNTFGVMSMDEIVRDLAERAEVKKFWQKATIYRNGIHTTVKWADGTITRVKCGEDDEQSDNAAYEAALVKRLYGSRSAYKKFVKAHVMDGRKKKDQVKKEPEREPVYDMFGHKLKVGDKFIVPDLSVYQEWYVKAYRDYIREHGYLTVEETSYRMVKAKDFDSGFDADKVIRIEDRRK